MRIYVASSWRCQRQPAVVEALRDSGHEVYDFRHPPGRTGFAWSDIDPEWEAWSASVFRASLDHPIARAGFASDHAAMEWADACVMVLPCGRSAHLELGWFAGQGKPTIILLDVEQEPELMYLEATRICLSIGEVVELLAPRPRVLHPGELVLPCSR